MPRDHRNQETYSFAEICRNLAKPPWYVRATQKGLDLHTPSKDEGYSQAYLAFLEKVLALRTLQVSLDDLARLLRMERKILHLLNLDALHDAPTWYLETCTAPVNTDTSLLLTNQHLGFALDGNGVQAHLDFGTRNPELFSRAEVGEDICRVLNLYLAERDKVRACARRARPVLENALAWEKMLFPRNGT